MLLKDLITPQKEFSFFESQMCNNWRKVRTFVSILSYLGRKSHQDKVYIVRTAPDQLCCWRFQQDMAANHILYHLDRRSLSGMATLQRMIHFAMSILGCSSTLMKESFTYLYVEELIMKQIQSQCTKIIKTIWYGYDWWLRCGWKVC